MARRIFDVHTHVWPDKVASSAVAYLPVEAGDWLDFAIETSGESSERARMELVQAVVELLPGASLT